MSLRQFVVVAAKRFFFPNKTNKQANNYISLVVEKYSKTSWNAKLGAKKEEDDEEESQP